jgi:hypothetical protein
MSVAMGTALYYSFTREGDAFSSHTKKVTKINKNMLYSKFISAIRYVLKLTYNNAQSQNFPGRRGGTPVPLLQGKGRAGAP